MSILIEWRLICYFLRDGRYLNIDLEFRKQRYKFFVEICNRARYQRNVPNATAARLDDQLMCDEVEIDLGCAVAAGHGTRRQTPRRHEQGNMPEFRFRWCQAQANLAHNLHEHVQRVVRFLPCAER